MLEDTRRRLFRDLEDFDPAETWIAPRPGQV